MENEPVKCVLCGKESKDHFVSWCYERESSTAQFTPPDNRGDLPEITQKVSEPKGEAPAETPKHGMNCPALSVHGCEADCTCGWKFRVQARTEQELHNAWRKRAEEAEQREAQLRAENERLTKENTRLKLAASPDTWWDDDTRYDSPEEFADEKRLAIGDEFVLTGATYTHDEKYRVTKVPDDTNDDFECELVYSPKEQFESYFAMEDRAKTAESKAERLETALREIMKAGPNATEMYGIAVLAIKKLEAEREAKKHDC